MPTNQRYKNIFKCDNSDIPYNSNTIHTCRLDEKGSDIKKSFL